MSDLQRKNRLIVLCVLGIVLGMSGLTAASVPLYNLFCAVTGYGGTTGTANDAPGKSSERVFTVTFDGNTEASLPWEFGPDQYKIETHPGQKTLISFHAKNLAAENITGTALYNVSPPKAGRYFRKIECFCFGEQVLNPGQETSMPVLFFIDPAIENDPNMKDVTTITLSYTFFKVESPALDKAMEDFYNRPAGKADGGAT